MGFRLVQPGGNSELVLWDVLTKQERLLVSLPKDEMLLGNTARSPDGKLLATATGDGAIRLWDTNSWQEVNRLELPRYTNSSGLEFRRHVNRIAFAPDGTSLAAVGTGDGRFELSTWDLSTGQIKVDRELAGAGNGVAFLPDGERIALGLARGPKKPALVEIWRLSALASKGTKPERSFPGPPQTALTAVSPDGRTLAAAFREQIVLYDLASGRSLPLGIHDGKLICLEFSPDGKYLATGGMNNPDRVGPETLKLWDLSTRQSRPLPKQPAGWGTISVAFSPDGKWLASSMHRPNDAPDRVFLWPLDGSTPSGSQSSN